MGGEYCMCPKAPCPICHTKECDCGCGFGEYTEEWMYHHVESREEIDRRKALEQYNAEIEIMQIIEESEDHNPHNCFCTRHWG